MFRNALFVLPLGLVACSDRSGAAEDDAGSDAGSDASLRTDAGAVPMDAGEDGKEPDAAAQGYSCWEREVCCGANVYGFPCRPGCTSCDWTIDVCETACDADAECAAQAGEFHGCLCAACGGMGPEGFGDCAETTPGPCLDDPPSAACADCLQDAQSRPCDAECSACERLPTCAT